MANVLAIGDQYNDLEMLAAVGHGAAMPSAPAPVRAAARYIAPPVADEGAAQLIERLVLASPASAARDAAALDAEHTALSARARVAPGAANDEAVSRSGRTERTRTRIGARRA